jgi:predicted RNA-binding Zn ribbon-like protein
MDDLDLVGGHVALDFANTGSLDGAPPSERLTSYRDLVTFALRTELIGPARAAELRAEAERRPDAAAAVLERALALRAGLDQMFSAVAASRQPAPEDIAVLNGFLEEGMRYRRLEPDDRCCGWTWAVGDEPLAQMLWPIANEAADLLVAGDLDRVKACGNDTCGWLFVDMSRNRSRRWCDMKDCGNRAKARRHYARRRDSPAS